MAATLLAIDYGKKRVGVAVGNNLTKSATPLSIITRQSDAQVLQAIKALVNEWQVSELVIGIPRQPDYTPHEMTAACEVFAQRLRDEFNVVVHEVDERYSSAVLMSQSKRRADGSVREVPQDDKAAAVILQQFLDEL
ncbi:putative pre-16S rRNA nuclease [Formosimonas limnophila]|uniref:Putative pre-16S rRNA nuclease n=1 Tax=Formosimonas limnophila TaxID=1384487 RepID=A0A8J3CNC0_9BURK|nr:Holliday junction resolvase RuvX [Formosimonas limnophila]GHA73776.1 putative pre-16S rRNA nuclease [Formosimonas limnophila]